MKRSAIKKTLKWLLIAAGAYLILTTLFFGYDDIDPHKGFYNYYWSGLNALWKKDKPFGFKRNEPVPATLNGVDGPYVFGNLVYTVNKNNTLKAVRYDSLKAVLVQVDHQELPSFTVRLNKAPDAAGDEYAMPDKLIAISDIEGNFSGFYGFLLANKVIDRAGNWLFGNGHLVLNGDFVDRGREVSQVLWFIYRLENQALEKGGKVHFVLGNHEVMNLYGDATHNQFKYIAVARQISGQNEWYKAVSYLYSEHAELGRWLRTKNIIEKIGPYIFVHAGLNIGHINGRYSIHALNATAKKYYGTAPSAKTVKDERNWPVVSSVNSPYWDRGLHFGFLYKIMYAVNGIAAKRTTQEELDKILDYYQAKKIVIGHSIVDDIQMDYHNKVIKIDVRHGTRPGSGQTRGLLIEKGTEYSIDDQGLRKKL